VALIHPTALVDRAAELAEGVEVGPYSVIGPKVRVGAGTIIGPHVVIDGRTAIGRNNRLFPFCSIGGSPQDKKYGGEDTELVIGDGNTIRESCTISLGTAQGGGVTRIGSDNDPRQQRHAGWPRHARRLGHHGRHVGHSPVLLDGAALDGRRRLDRAA
jgi:UDP-N-acetylglucosamine acyltransferase